MKWEIDLRMVKEGDGYKYSEKEEHKSKEGEGRDKRPRREARVLVNSGPLPNTLRNVLESCCL